MGVEGVVGLDLKICSLNFWPMTGATGTAAHSYRTDATVSISLCHEDGTYSNPPYGIRIH